MLTKSGFRVGERIRAWRKKRNMIQKELAAAVKMDVTQLWSIEKDRNSPSVRTLERIAKALHVSVPELLEMPSTDDSRMVLSVAEESPFAYLDRICSDLHRISRPEKGTDLTERDVSRLETELSEAIQIESRHQTEMQTSLPLQFPIVKSEAGAEQLARAVRAHCDVGAAIIRNVQILFETYGVRILDTQFSNGVESVTFYNAARRDFTVCLADTLLEQPWRRDFTFLSEIGRMFWFAANSFETYRESAAGRRFAHHFAAAFLQPEQTIRATVYSLRVKPDDWTWELLLRMKTRFGVSAHSFAIRLKELGLISRRKYDLLMGKIKSLGLEEPFPQSNTDLNRRGDLLALG